MREMLECLACIKGCRLWPQKSMPRSGLRRPDPDLGPVSVGSEELSWPACDDSPRTSLSPVILQGANLAGFPLSSAWIVTSISEGPFLSCYLWLDSWIISLLPSLPMLCLLMAQLHMCLSPNEPSFQKLVLLPVLPGADSGVLLLSHPYISLY